MFCLKTKSFLVIILKPHSWCYLRLSLQKLCLCQVFDKYCNSKYKRKLTRNVNVENEVRQASRANASEREDYDFFHNAILNLNHG
jgi:hypothetical protein